MNSPLSNRIALGLAIPALAAGAWSAAGLIATDSTPLPQCEAALPLDRLPSAVSAEDDSTGANSKRTSVVDLANSIWKEKWTEPWERILALDQKQAEQESLWIESIVAGKPHNRVQQLRDDLNIDDDVEQKFSSLETLSKQIASLLEEGGQNLTNECDRYLTQVKDLGIQVQKQIDSINADIKNKEEVVNPTVAKAERQKPVKKDKPRSEVPKSNRRAILTESGNAN